MTLEDYLLLSAVIKHIWLSWYASCVITEQSQTVLHGKLDVSKVIAERTYVYRSCRQNFLKFVSLGICLI